MPSWIRGLVKVVGFGVFWIGMMGGAMVNGTQIGRPISAIFSWGQWNTNSQMSFDCPMGLDPYETTVVTATMYDGYHSSAGDFVVRFWAAEQFPDGDPLCEKDVTLPIDGKAEVTCSIRGVEIRGVEKSGVIAQAFVKEEPEYLFANYPAYQGVCAIHVSDIPEILPYGILIVIGGILWLFAHQQPLSRINYGLAALIVLAGVTIGSSLRFEHMGFDGGDILFEIMMILPLLIPIILIGTLIKLGLKLAKSTKADRITVI